MPKHLTFDGKYFDKVREARKTITLRKHKPNLAPGDIVYLHSKGYVIGKAEIQDVRPIKVRELTDDIAKKEGFRSKNDLFLALKEIYRNIKPDDELWLVEFKLLKKFDPPIFSEAFPYKGIHPLEIAKKTLEHSEELGVNDTERILLELLIKTGSIRRASEALGSLSKRGLFRKILRKYLNKLIDLGILKPKMGDEDV